MIQQEPLRSWRSYDSKRAAQKIVPLSELKDRRWSLVGHIAVMCHGVFDVLHPGHLVHFRQAREHAPCLIVALVADRHVNKGPGHPFFTESLRADMLSALEMVSFVTIVDSALAMPALEAMKPEIYCKGPDYRDPHHPFADGFRQEVSYVDSYGGKTVLTSGFTASSSGILRRIEVMSRE